MGKGAIMLPTTFLNENRMSIRALITRSEVNLMPIKLLILLSVFLTNTAIANEVEFVEVVKTNKRSTVGVGYYDPLGAPKTKLSGTGFVIADGTLIATNFHVVSNLPESNGIVSWVVFTGQGKRPNIHKVKIVAKDEQHDLAILKLPQGVTLPAMKLANNDWVDDGYQIAFTGYPIGEVLGLYPVTHQGMISARTPTVIPASNSTEISAARLRLLRDPYFTYQLDATAYPGNSGSAVYLKSTGEVIAIVNKVFVKKSKESILSDPSNITYAIPVLYLNKLIDSL